MVCLGCFLCATKIGLIIIVIIFTFIPPHIIPPSFSPPSATTTTLQKQVQKHSDKLCGGSKVHPSLPGQKELPQGTCVFFNLSFYRQPPHRLAMYFCVCCGVHVGVLHADATRIRTSASAGEVKGAGAAVWNAEKEDDRLPGVFFVVCTSFFVER